MSVNTDNHDFIYSIVFNIGNDLQNPANWNYYYDYFEVASGFSTRIDASIQGNQRPIQTAINGVVTYGVPFGLPSELPSEAEVLTDSVTIDSISGQKYIGNLTADSILLQKNAMFEGSLTTSEFTAYNNVTFLPGSQLHAPSVLDSRVYVNGTLTLDGTASFSSAFLEDVEVNGSLVVDGSALVNGELTGAGTITVENGGAFDVLGSSAKADIAFKFNGLFEGYGEKISFSDAPGGTFVGFQDGDLLSVGLSLTGKITVSYDLTGELTVGASTFGLTGPDPEPTIVAEGIDARSVDISTIPVATLLDMAFISYSAPNFPDNPDAYSKIDATTDAGFAAVAYRSISNYNIVIISFRGTYTSSKMTAIKNLFADISFPALFPNSMLDRYVYDASKFVAHVVSTVNAGRGNAEFVLTGHSLGGALAQIVGKATGFAAAAFNSPGAAALVPELSSELNPVGGLGGFNSAGVGEAGTNINYRLDGDQVSEAGTPTGQVVTIADPAIEGYAASTPAQVVQNFLTIHSTAQNGQYKTAFSNILDINSYHAGLTGTNITGALEPLLFTKVGTAIVTAIATISNLLVVTGLARAVDPLGGTLFTLTGNPGTPEFSGIALPVESGIAKYAVAYEDDAILTAFHTIEAGATANFPINTSSLEFEALDSSGNPITMPGGFLFAPIFASTGTFSGTLTITNPQTEGPSTADTTLNVAANAGPTSLNISAPYDSSYSDPTDLEIGVRSLPTDGAVTLADGVTPLTLGEALTVGQLTGLLFTPESGEASPTSSSLMYDVTDPDFNTTTGSVSVDVACFASGTHIDTSNGQVCVETLREGDLVRLACGDLAPITWIGHRRVDCTRHPAPRDVWPVCVAAGAFAPKMPARDLFLSPDHAVFVAGVLVPVRHLVNGTTIAQSARDSVTYWHVELDRHDVLLADGLPCESYLDTGNRRAFAGEAVCDPHPSFGRDAALAWSEGGCAPLVEHGPALDDIRAGLDRRAAALGHAAPCAIAAAPEMGAPVGGDVAAGVALVRLVCPARRIGADRRRLGALVTGLRIDGATVAIDDPRLGLGFHEVETHDARRVRWTDGNATLSLEPSEVARRVEFDVAMVAA